MNDFKIGQMVLRTSNIKIGQLVTRKHGFINRYNPKQSSKKHVGMIINVGTESYTVY
tara:strand:+ start:38942 stop:39112 length:171 start_codon:yes stop_codon:yes gene_type:complete